MFLEVGGTSYELNTKLGTAKKIEKRFKLSISNLFEKIQSADIDELVEMISLAIPAGGEVTSAGFKEALMDSMDYTDLLNSVQELLANIMFSGTDEQIEGKIAKSGGDEGQKNALRAMLKLPLKELPEA